MLADVSAETISIRRAATNDVDAIRRIDHQVYPTPWSPSMLLQQIVGDDRLHLVAEVTDQLVAHAGILFLADEGHVSTIAVDPDHQRRTVGHNLLLILVRAAIDAGVSGITLEVRAQNQAALALYRRFGLAPVGVRRGYYGDNGDDALVLWTPALDSKYRARIAAMQLSSNIVLTAELSNFADRTNGVES